MNLRQMALDMGFEAARIEDWMQHAGIIVKDEMPENFWDQMLDWELEQIKQDRMALLHA